MRKPKVINVRNVPDDIFLMVCEKKKAMEKKGIFQFGFGAAMLQIIRDLLNHKKNGDQFRKD